jgi:hypothetical protein
MSIKGGIHKVERSEVELKLTEEDKLISTMATQIGIDDPDVSVESSIKKAYYILDEVIRQKEARLITAMGKEYRRRKVIHDFFAK